MPPVCLVLGLSQQEGFTGNYFRYRPIARLSEADFVEDFDLSQYHVCANSSRAVREPIEAHDTDVMHAV